ncbi:hypothetical protein PROFUN_05512 [Planoprotostelium fungivorum]|uniref:Uncharacterized protein n=1 Tax=Planoprotostelium fungivorum TaxID=1890364 RepID=A0A2P6NQY6_9EUKA|nr:hypothetical protein PROFUN_05512 [Planoprotostelium fungivorum]
MTLTEGETDLLPLTQRSEQVKGHVFIFAARRKKRTKSPPALFSFIMIKRTSRITEPAAPERRAPPDITMKRVEEVHRSQVSPNHVDRCAALANLLQANTSRERIVQKKQMELARRKIGSLEDENCRLHIRLMQGAKIQADLKEENELLLQELILSRLDYVHERKRRLESEKMPYDELPSPSERSI